MFNITFSGILFSLRSVVPLLVFACAASAVVFVFKCINYQGSFIPAAALILLMELGLLLKVRLAIFPKNALYPETIPVGFNGTVWYYVLLYIFSLVVLVVIVMLFFCRRQIRLWRTGRLLEWLSVPHKRDRSASGGKDKYIVTFAATVSIVGMLIVLASLFNDGKFLFSRIPWETAKVLIPLSLSGFLTENSRLLQPFQNSKLTISLTGWGPFFLMAGVPLFLFSRGEVYLALTRRLRTGNDLYNKHSAASFYCDKEYYFSVSLY